MSGSLKFCDFANYRISPSIKKIAIYLVIHWFGMFLPVKFCLTRDRAGAMLFVREIFVCHPCMSISF